MSTRSPLIIIVGPTASGKSELAIKLAKKFNGEIISADSRQVYRGMDIGTSKVSKKERHMIPHHLLDVANPKNNYNVAHFQCDAKKAILKILSKGKLPFMVGGSAFWIDAVAFDMNLPKVKPNPALRKKLSMLSTARLHAMLKKLNPERAKLIDRQNPYRLIRAIEIVKATKKPIGKVVKRSPYNVLWLGITVPKKKLYKRIDERLATRMRKGLVAEVKRLLLAGVPASRLIGIGLEYRYVTLYLQGKLTKHQMIDQLRTAIHQYAKRQMTWWRRNKEIHWIQTPKQAEKVIITLMGRRGFHASSSGKA